MSKLPVAALVAVLIILGIGTFIEGKLSDRWGRDRSDKLAAFTERLNEVPKQFGDWVGVDDEINMEEFKASNCEGCVSRTYTNREGQQVNMYLVSGTARHVTIHTPDWCYVGAGFTKEDDPQQYTITEVDDVQTPPEFLKATFRKEDPLGTSRQRIFWTFSDDGQWRGPRMPKPTFAGRSALYKMYLITDLSNGLSSNDIDGPQIGFVRDFMPILNGILFEDSDQQL